MVCLGRWDQMEKVVWTDVWVSEDAAWRAMYAGGVV